jgi:hypothetical protein
MDQSRPKLADVTWFDLGGETALPERVAEVAGKIGGAPGSSASAFGATARKAPISRQITRERHSRRGPSGAALLVNGRWRKVVDVFFVRKRSRAGS